MLFLICLWACHHTLPTELYLNLLKNFPPVHIFSWFYTIVNPPLTCWISRSYLITKYYYVINWKHFPRYWPFVRGIHRSPVNSPHKDQWLRALVFSLICAWINGWVNNREAGDLRRHRAHNDTIVMKMAIYGPVESPHKRPVIRSAVFHNQKWYTYASETAMKELSISLYIKHIHRLSEHKSHIINLGYCHQWIIHLTGLPM